MIIEHNGVQYEMVRASDIDRDGMALELYEVSGSVSNQILEAFWFDEDDNFTFSAFREQIPFEIVELFVAKAREMLPPVEES